MQLESFKRKATVAGAQDCFAVCDIAGFVKLAESVPQGFECCNESVHNGRSTSWHGGKTFAKSLGQVRDGDLSGVAASDKILSEIEAFTPLTQAWRQRFDVVGGVPCVPAFLAGQPMNMRRRERVAVEQGPLTIFASLEVSAGVDIKTMRARGAAILALVRLLGNARPVELWACCSVGGHGYASHVLIRIDTAPLDLARASHILTCPSVARSLSYAACDYQGRELLGKTWGGGWSYNNENTYRKSCRDTFISVTNPTSDALLVPAAHVNDPMIKTPTVWLANMLRQYGGLEQEAA